ncbi:MAG: hypothetical protein KA740_11360 [Rhodoferax sp.]|nr:hypothetical protein [Rhodoferax sp.]
MNPVLQAPALRTPLRAFWNWLTETPPLLHVGSFVSAQRQTPFRAVSRATQAVTLRSQVLANQPNLPARRNAHRPLRTVRVMENGQPPGQVGRMVMSGRMADVCAELDRLAACEARLH